MRVLSMIKNALSAPQKTYAVFIEWDSEAKVWIAYSDDIPGLATEAADMDKLNERVCELAMDLIGEDIKNSHSGVLMQPKSTYIPLEGNMACV